MFGINAVNSYDVGIFRTFMALFFSFKVCITNEP